MDYSSFLQLHSILKEGMDAAKTNLTPYKRKGGRKRKGGKYLPLPTTVRLACAICYASGGSPYDLMSLYGVSYPDF